MRRTLVHVTQKDIIQGAQHDCDSCPVRLALRRTRLAAYKVGKRNLYGNDLPGIMLPLAAQDWIDCFDRGRLVKPISFVVEEGDA
jgi:hypothetical protein